MISEGPVTALDASERGLVVTHRKPQVLISTPACIKAFFYILSYFVQSSPHFLFATRDAEAVELNPSLRLARSPFERLIPSLAAADVQLSKGSSAESLMSLSNASQLFRIENGVLVRAASPRSASPAEVALALQSLLAACMPQNPPVEEPTADANNYDDPNFLFEPDEVQVQAPREENRMVPYDARAQERVDYQQLVLPDGRSSLPPLNSFPASDATVTPSEAVQDLVEKLRMLDSPTLASASFGEEA